MKHLFPPHIGKFSGGREEAVNRKLGRWSIGSLQKKRAVSASGVDREQDFGLVRARQSLAAPAKVPVESQTASKLEEYRVSVLATPVAHTGSGGGDGELPSGGVHGRDLHPKDPKPNFGQPLRAWLQFRPFSSCHQETQQRPRRCNLSRSGAERSIPCNHPACACVSWQESSWQGSEYRPFPNISTMQSQYTTNIAPNSSKFLSNLNSIIIQSLSNKCSLGETYGAFFIPPSPSSLMKQRVRDQML